MFNYVMNLTEISRSQILDNLFPQKNYHHNGWNAISDASQGEYRCYLYLTDLLPNPHASLPRFSVPVLHHLAIWGRN